MQLCNFVSLSAAAKQFLYFHFRLHLHFHIYLYIYIYLYIALFWVVWVVFRFSEEAFLSDIGLKESAAQPPLSRLIGDSSPQGELNGL